jgi:hypothetical protein
MARKLIDSSPGGGEGSAIACGTARTMPYAAPHEVDPPGLAS